MIKKFLSEFSLGQCLKFLVGGGSAVITDALLYALLQGTLGVSAAKAVSYIAGAAVGFVINKLWTFQSKGFSSGEVVKYIILYAFSAGANTLVNRVVLDIFGSSVFAFLCATGTSTVINFLGQKFIVFRKGEGE